jgi:uncharacterized protein YbjT (DUF2867 family)
MKNVMITGATGMVGSIVLQESLNAEVVGKVISISRKPFGTSHPKLQELIHDNFLEYSGLEDHFKNLDVAYFCIGVYTGSVTDEQFKTITVDYTATFADMLKKYSPDARVCFLSGAGADSKEKSRMSFARYKGMAENYLINQKFGGLHIFRPGYIYPVEKRKEPNFTYVISRKLYPLFRLFGKNFSIKSTELGKAIFTAGIEGTEKTILENKDILKIIENE